MSKKKLFTMGFVVTLFFCLTTANAADEFEQPGKLNATMFLSSKAVKGEHHHVKEIVKNDGFLNHYKINSDFGQFEITSTSGLTMLIKEIYAIAEMRKVETDDNRKGYPGSR